MSKYTTQLRWIVEQTGEGQEVPKGQRYANAVYEVLGLSDYPIWLESYRKFLNDKIIDHFYFREIGFETAAQFRWYMRRTMNEIMPYYNQLYVSKDLVTEPLTDVDKSWDEAHTLDRDTDTTENVDGRTTAHSESAGTSHERTVFQDTPMSLLDNTVAPTVQGLDYATNVTYVDGSTTDETDSNGTSLTDTVGNVIVDEEGTRIHNEKGRNRSQSELLLEYRKTFINIDMEVIADLEDLFLSLW